MGYNLNNSNSFKSRLRANRVSDFGTVSIATNICDHVENKDGMCEGKDNHSEKVTQEKNDLSCLDKNLVSGVLGRNLDLSNICSKVPGSDICDSQTNSGLLKVLNTSKCSIEYLDAQNNVGNNSLQDELPGVLKMIFS